MTPTIEERPGPAPGTGSPRTRRPEGERRRAPTAGAAVWGARAALVGAGALMSFWRLDVPSWNLDEIAYAFVGDRYWDGDFHLNREHPPVGKFLVGGSRLLFGPTLFASRLPAAVAMFAAGLLLWWWLGRVGPRFAGPIAAALWWTLPGLNSFPETDEPSVWMMRLAVLDPLAAVLGLAALVAGWWWLGSGRLRAAAVCGALAGLAIATKLPAGLVVAVPAVVGCVAVLLGRPVAGRHAVAGTLPRGGRLGRAVGHGLVWLGSAGAVFVAAYLPMGERAVGTFRTGWEFQRAHGSLGHTTLVAGEATKSPPWWSFAWWEYAAVGGAAATVLVLCTVAAVVGRPLLGGYVTAAWVLPMLLLLPVGHVALPGYLQLWRPALVAGVAVGAAAALAWAWPRLPRPVTVVAAAVAAVLVAVPAARAVEGIARLAPTDYAALPAVVPAKGKVWIIGHPASAYVYLSPDRLTTRRPAAPAAIAVDRAVARRSGDRGAPAWARANGYRLVRTGSLDVWVRPDR